MLRERSLRVQLWEALQNAYAQLTELAALLPDPYLWPIKCKMEVINAKGGKSIVSHSQDGSGCGGLGSLGTRVHGAHPLPAATCTTT